MSTLNNDMQEYQRQLKLGGIKAAYVGLIKLMSNLRIRFQNNHPELFVSNSIYPGMMDMTFFTLSPASLHKKKLKIVIVFLHETFQFEAWLSGANKQVQARYWNFLKNNPPSAYPVVSNINGTDAIITRILVAGPDFSNLDALTTKIEQSTLVFVSDMEILAAALEM